LLIDSKIAKNKNFDLLTVLIHITNALERDKIPVFNEVGTQVLIVV